MYFFAKIFKGPVFFVLTRKRCIVYSLFMILLGTFVGTMIIFSSYATNDNGEKSLSIIVDAGHGIPDGGAVGITGSIEQEINLDIALKLQEVLEAKNINVVMTRTDEYGLWDNENSTIREKKVSDMNNRLKIMKESDSQLFVSIHMNSFPNHSATGLRIFYAPNHPEIKPLAENIQVRIRDITGAKTTVVKSADKTLFLMKNPPIPAILVECGFLSNPKDEQNLKSEDYQARLAWAIADAIEKYYIFP